MPPVIGKFEILRPLGKGAMGEVFLGKDPVLGREVAIKTIQAGTAFGEEARARFEREAKATAALNHPNIVTVYDFGQQDDLAYLVMEFVEGETLESLIAAGAPKEDLLEALAQVCEGLAYAHERGVIHRDVKPSNILVTRRGRRIQAKLMDFGVALVDRSTLTEQGVWMGTLSYMAPEYLDTGKATPSSDLFAVGIILYEVLTGGRKPFQAETSTGILNAILRKPAEPIPAESVRGISPAILEITRRALAKDPAERHPSAEALAHAILDALEAPPTPASPAPPPTQGAARPKATALVVGKGGKATCLSLRVALRQAEPGARILILPGTYRESVVIDKEVTLVGEGEPSATVLVSPKGPVIQARGGRVTLEGLTLKAPEDGVEPVLEIAQGQALLQGCFLEAARGPALDLAPETSVELKSCHLRGGGEELIRSGGRLDLDGGHLTGGAWTCIALLPGGGLGMRGTHLGPGMGLGVHLAAGTSAVLEDATLEGLQGGGLELERGARLEARRCAFRSSRSAGVLAQEKGQVILEECEVAGHEGSGIHLAGGASGQLQGCRIHGNSGYGLSVMDQGLATLAGCEVSENGHAGVLVHRGATAQLRDCRLLNGRSVGVACLSKGKGILEACEIAGNAQTGGRVDPGGSLLLIRCVIRDGQDTGLLLFEDAEATLEQCVVHRNARGGILLARDAADPVLRGSNQIEDALMREDASGTPVRLAPLKKR